MRKLQLDWQGYYPVDEKTVRDKVDDRAGVFKLSRRQGDGSLKPFYTAQASSLKMRLLEIITSTEVSCIKERLDKGDCHFRFAYLYTKEDLDCSERALYRRYTPRCSDKAALPEAPDVEINYN